MSDERIPRRLSPSDFGAPPDDEWIDPGDELVEFLKDDPEVDWTNLWVRRGARDEIAGKLLSANPYTVGDGQDIARPNWRGWRDGWMASGNFHGYFNRPALRSWQKKVSEWQRVQSLIDWGYYKERGLPEPSNPFPDSPDFIIRRRSPPRDER